jgi:pimeloyl-[acyl-carrier protein] synthase
MTNSTNSDVEMSLCQLLEPSVMADPYPLYAQLREEDPVHWDPFLQAWVVTRYADAVDVLHRFSADRAPSAADFEALSCASLSPIAQVMAKQMLFLDGAAHARLRSLAAVAFSPQRVKALCDNIRKIVDGLIDKIAERGHAELLADFGEPLPAMVTAEILGVPASDHRQLKAWSLDFGRMLGSIHHAAEFSSQIIRSVNEAVVYFRDAIHQSNDASPLGLVQALATAEIDGVRLTEEEVIANCILVTVGAQEEITNLIGNGVLTLLRHPHTIAQLSDTSMLPAAVEELLRYESPTQQTMRVAPEDVMFGGKLIRKRQQVIVLLAAANRDPEKFADPERFDPGRKDNRHLAFGWAAHFCFGATLARAQGQIAIERLLRRLANLSLESPQANWRTNLSLRGLQSLPVRFDVQDPVQAVVLGTR